ncbi:MAG: IS200/IS605 family transposase [Symploca sp. SIO2E9]|nr:IS200/IS605 family transposase [Symploca sp. SIO2E9]
MLEFGGEADHVHLLIEAHPAMDLSQMIGNLKTVTSRRIRAEYAEHLRRYYWKPFFWSKSYAVISVGGRAPLAKLVEYICSQDKPPNAV